MEFRFYRDLGSIAFIRCLSRIPETSNYAEGTGFLLSTARAKCHSELEERVFHRSLPFQEKEKLMGIAAHPSIAEAKRNAWNEALETIFLERIASSEPPKAISIGRAGRLQFTLARFDRAWLTLIRFPHAGTQCIVQAVAGTLLVSILKAWTEVRNIQIYNPSLAELPSYTKGNRILAGKLNFKLSPGIKNLPVARENYSFVSQRTPSHHVTYVRKEII